MPRRKAQPNRYYQSTAKVPVTIELDLVLTDLPPPPPKGKKYLKEAFKYGAAVAERADDIARGFILENLRWSRKEWPNVKASVVTRVGDPEGIRNAIIRQFTGEQIY